MSRSGQPSKPASVVAQFGEVLGGGGGLLGAGDDGWRRAGGRAGGRRAVGARRPCNRRGGRHECWGREGRGRWRGEPADRRIGERLVGTPFELQGKGGEGVHQGRFSLASLICAIAKPACSSGIM